MAKNLSTLIPTAYIEPRIVNGKERWGNQTDSGQNKLSPSDNRAELRSKTYPGIARAMAAQWTYTLNQEHGKEEKEKREPASR